jgi:hypothetical protein
LKSQWSVTGLFNLVSAVQMLHILCGRRHEEEEEEEEESSGALTGATLIICSYCALCTCMVGLCPH